MKHDGGPAFAQGGLPGAPTGMSLRDYFAAHAMAALMVSPHLDLKREQGTHEGIAIGAYEFADAMLAQRGKDSSRPQGEK